MGQDTAQIRREIEATRARMGDTVEALGYKADVPARMRENVSDRIESVKGTIGDVVAGAKNAVIGTTQTVTQNASDSLSGARDSFADARDTLADAGDRAQTAAQGAAKSTKEVVSIALENPLGLALAGLAIGLLAGLVVPISDIERDRIGPVRDQIADRAQTAVAQAVDAGKTILSDAVTTAAQSAQTQGADIARSAVSGTPLEQQAPTAAPSAAASASVPAATRAPKKARVVDADA
jgi:ElaB/YqjD/DUF883 family membrane-anchored ribosome-binding protein